MGNSFERTSDLARDTDRKGGPLTPLGVISLFLSFTEVALSVAVMQTTGGVQRSLTAFVIAFPISIATAFFVILWSRNYVFYAPHEYGGVPDVRSFVDAMRNATATSEPIAEIVQRNIASTLLSDSTRAEVSRLIGDESGRDSDESLSAVLRSISSKAAQSVRESFVRVDSRPLLGANGAAFDLAYDGKEPVYHFLDKVYFKLTSHVRPYRYPIDWVLRDRETGRTFQGIGRHWARSVGRADDDRPIEDVGIIAGQQLEVVRP